MSDPRKHSLILPVAVVAVLLALYVGAYCGMGDPRWMDRVEDPPYFELSTFGRFTSRLFAPMCWLDRRIRPDVWEPTP